MRTEQVFCDTCKADITDIPEGCPLRVEVSAGFVFSACYGEFCSWECATEWFTETSQMKNGFTTKRRK